MGKQDKIQPILPELAEHIDKTIKDKVGFGTGFCLYVFKTDGTGDGVQYVTNVPEEIVMDLLKGKSIEQPTKENSQSAEPYPLKDCTIFEPK